MSCETEAVESIEDIAKSSTAQAGVTTGSRWGSNLDGR